MGLIARRSDFRPTEGAIGARNPCAWRAVRSLYPEWSLRRKVEGARWLAFKVSGAGLRRRGVGRVMVLIYLGNFRFNSE